MSAGEWLGMRALELAAACATAAVLIGGLAAGVPFLVDRVPEVFFYSACCIAAVVLRAVLDLAVRAGMAAVRHLRPVAAPRPVVVPARPASALN
ncbi:MAG TPA: hypothetical protein VET65_08645 [Candidatus Limnocylindrales bacterium]|nr:hypothetical protein [Candidatus Limnocylindrales bacterium]